MSDNINNDIIRSLLNDLINKVNETKGDKNLQKQNETIISTLKDISQNIKNNSLDTENLAKEIAKEISDKITPVIRETSDNEIKTIQDVNDEPQHSGKVEDSSKPKNNINPDATEPSGPSSKISSEMSKRFSKINLASAALETSLAALGVAAVEVNKGLENTYRSFSTLSDAGINFGGSAEQMRKAAVDSGMSLEQFTKNLTNSNGLFRTLGTEEISRFNRAVVDASNKTEGLALSVEQRQSFEQDYIDNLVSQGRLRTASDTDVTNGFIDLAKQSRGLSSVFGESADSIAKKASDFLKTREGYANVTSLMANQQNSQLFTSLAQTMFEKLQVPENLRRDIMNYSATGVQSTELRKYMASSAANTNQINDLIRPLSQIANSRSNVNIQEIMPTVARSIERIGQTRTQYDMLDRTQRGVMNAYQNPLWNNEITASNTANQARNFDFRSMMDNLNKTLTGIENTSTLTRAANTRNQISQTTIPMLTDAAQSAAMNTMKETILASEKTFQHSVESVTNSMNKLADRYISNTSSIDKLTSTIAKAADNPVGHFGIGTMALAGDVIATAVGAMLGHSLPGIIGMSILRGTHHSGGGISSIIRSLRGHLPGLMNGFFKSSSEGVKSTATNAAEHATGDLANGIKGMERSSSSLSRSIGSLVKNVSESGALKTVVKRAAPIATAGIAAYDLANNYNDYKTGKETHDQWKENNYKEVGSAGGGLAGASAGALAGAAIGSVVPILGTALGGLIGGVAGGMLGSSVGSTIGDTGYHLMNSPTKKEKEIIKEEKPTVPPTDIHKPDYLRNIDKNVDLIKGIINDNSSDNNTDNQKNKAQDIIDSMNQESNDLTNDFTEEKPTTKSEADLDSIVKGIHNLLEKLDLLVDVNVDVYQEMSTQNSMFYDQLNRLNSTANRQLNKKTNKF